MEKKASVILCILLTLLVAADNVVIASATLEWYGILDQYQDEHILCQSLIDFAPMGQEFTPTMRRLLTVAVYLCDSGGGNTTLVMNIRNGSITGPILVSKSFHVSAGFEGWVYVRMKPIWGIKIVPGKVYVIELQATVNWGWCSSGGPVSTYPGGRQILAGVPQENNDATFRTYGFYI